MTVELATGEPGQGPFIWPEEPEDWRPWAKEQFADAFKQRDKIQKDRQNAGKVWPEDMGSVRSQAAKLLEKAGRTPEGVERGGERA